MKKKSNFGIYLLLIIDILLLVVIITSAISQNKTKEINSGRFAADEEVVLEDNAVVSDVNTTETSRVVAEGESVVDEGQIQPLDTEGVEGIVDIDEDDGSDEISDNQQEGTGAFRLEDYSTDSRPAAIDFSWYMDDVYVNGIPMDSVPIYDSTMIVGDWKGFILYDPDNSFNSFATEYMNVNIDIQDMKADVTFDLYQYCPGNSEIINVSGEVMKYSGNYEAGAVYATGGGNVHLDSFYSLSDNRQYAVGRIDTVDGTPAYLALVRP